MEEDVTAIDMLKISVIKEYMNFIKRLELGYVDKYDSIILKILLIQLSDNDIDPRLYEYLLNN